ncbi:SDR family oxidoreductase, partial [Klebsiella pneumoniae]
CVCGKKIGPDPRNFNQRVSLGRNDLLIRTFPKSLAKQVAKRGIRVNAVAPGPYWTVLQSSGGQPDEKVKQFGKDTPMGRPGQPVEIAPLYVTLASDACSYTSGQVWCSDGGDGVV